MIFLLVISKPRIIKKFELDDIEKSLEIFSQCWFKIFNTKKEILIK